MAAGAGGREPRVTAAPGARDAALALLADIAAAVDGRIAVDGPDAAGKTALADELAALLRARGLGVHRLSVDSFLRPEAHRYRRGRSSPEGYYRDSFDYDAFRAAVRAAGNGRLLVDGVFLLRPELAALWSLSIYVRVAAGEVLRRGVLRDADRLGGTDAARELYLSRYLGGQRITTPRRDRRTAPTSCWTTMIRHGRS